MKVQMSRGGSGGDVPVFFGDGEGERHGGRISAKCSVWLGL